MEAFKVQQDTVQLQLLYLLADNCHSLHNQAFWYITHISIF